MSYFFPESLQLLLCFAGDFAPVSAETNEERLEQLFSWVESLEESPWPAGEEPFVSLQNAKELVQHMRASGVL